MQTKIAQQTKKFQLLPSYLKVLQVQWMHASYACPKLIYFAFHKA